MGFWSSSGQNFKLMIAAKIPVYSEKSTCQLKYKSQSEGTTKAQKSPCLLGSWEYFFLFFLECITGRILGDDTTKVQ